MITKYKLSDLAKDLKLTSAEIIELLSAEFGVKKTGSSLSPDEVNFVLETYTQRNQVESFDGYFNDKTPSKKLEPKKPSPKKEEVKPAPEVKKEEKPEEKAAEQKPAEQKTAEQKPSEQKAPEKKPEPQRGEKTARKEAGARRAHQACFERGGRAVGRAEAAEGR